jgi:hypothetical protein
MKYLFFLVLIAFVFANSQKVDSTATLAVPVATKVAKVTKPVVPKFVQKFPKLYTIHELIHSLHVRLLKRQKEIAEAIKAEKANVKAKNIAHIRAKQALTAAKVKFVKLSGAHKGAVANNEAAKKNLGKAKFNVQRELQKLTKIAEARAYAKGKFLESKDELLREKKEIDAEIKTIRILKKVVLSGAKRVNKKKK